MSLQTVIASRTGTDQALRIRHHRRHRARRRCSRSPDATQWRGSARSGATRNGRLRAKSTGSASMPRACPSFRCSPRSCNRRIRSSAKHLPASLQNDARQPDLWQFGISGDHPILLLRMTGEIPSPLLETAGQGADPLEAQAPCVATWWCCAANRPAMRPRFANESWRSCGIPGLTPTLERPAASISSPPLR